MSIRESDQTLSACPPFNNRPVFVVFNHSFSLLLPQYKKNEIATRLAAFIGAGVLAGAFGGLIAYGVSHINSKIQTWRILFLIEGLPSTLLGTAVILFLPSRPERSKYLTESERELEFLRLRSQNLEEVGSGIDWSGVKRAFTDWKSYAITVRVFSSSTNRTEISSGAKFIYSCLQLTLSSLSGFFPTIIKSLGYSVGSSDDMIPLLPSIPCFAHQNLLFFFRAYLHFFSSHLVSPPRGKSR